MDREKISQAVGNIDDRFIEEAADEGTYRKKDFGRSGIRGFWAAASAAAVILCLLVSGFILFRSSHEGMVTVYARETGEEITAAGAVLHTGTISDSGEMKGHPLMFYLSGEDIASVRFSCKREQLYFMDWTEKREEYGNAQNFTVPFGEDESEYYYLTIDWVPNTLIRELTDRADSTIAGLPAEMRSDVIVLEIIFEDGKTATKAIRVSLLDDGTFFAALEDYRIGEADAFVRRPDSPALPRDTLYAQGDSAAEGAGEVTVSSSADAPELICVGGSLYQRSMDRKESLAVREEELVYLGKIESNLTDSENVYEKELGGSVVGEEMGAEGEGAGAEETGVWVENEVPREDFQANHPIVGAEVYRYGDGIMVRVDGEYRFYEYQAQVKTQGGSRTESQGEAQGESPGSARTETVWHGEDLPADSMDADSLQAAEAAAKEYYMSTVFVLRSLEVKEQTAEEIVFSVRVSKGGVVQDPDRSITLRLEDGEWKVVNEGY